MGTFQLELPNGIRDNAGNWTKEVEISEMAGEEEDILADQTREQGGTGAVRVSGSQRITSILSRCTDRIGEERRPKDRYSSPDYFRKAWELAYSSDRLFSMIRLRQLSLGPLYVFSRNCPACKKEVKGITIDLSTLAVQNTDLSVARMEEHGFELPRSKDRVFWRFVRGADEPLIEQTMKSHQADWTSALVYRRITAVSTYDKESGLYLSPAPPPGGLVYPKRMLSADRRSLLHEFDRLEGGIDSDVQIICDECGHGFSTRVQVTHGDFFFPSEILSSPNSTPAPSLKSGDGATTSSSGSPSGDAAG